MTLPDTALENTALEAAPDGSVVVALDDSSQSRTALAWAAAYARTTGAGLYAVHVLRADFGLPESWSPVLGGAPHTVSGPELDFARDAVRTLFSDARLEPEVTLTMLYGSPGPEVVRFAARAGLLVVGTREHRGFERLVTGSVSHFCLDHARSPVVAVPLAVVTDAVGSASATADHREQVRT